MGRHMLRPIEKVIKKVQEGDTVLVEYEPTAHPERVFKEVFNALRERGIPILIVDIYDTLHLFLKRLEFQGESLDVGSAYVVLEKSSKPYGVSLGEVPPGEDFEYHSIMYSKTVKPFFTGKEGIKGVIVLGLEKFVLPFQRDRVKLERYFEVVERPLIYPSGKITFLFLNRKAISEYALRSFEESKHYVLEVSEGGVSILKEPPEGLV
jgi:hypothetical protein